MTSEDDRLGRPLPAGWHAPHAPLRKTLEGRIMRLEPLSAERHADALFDALADDPEGLLWTYRMQDPPANRAAFRAWVAEIECSPSMRYLAYVERATGRVLGKGAFMSMIPAAGVIEIGSIIVAPALQRTPGATEAMTLMLGWAFDAGYRRVEWSCDPLNAVSMRAAERLGFSYEACFRQAYVTKGRNRDKAYFAITDGDWPEIARAHAAWLSPESFGAEGAQQSRLSVMTAPLLKARAPAFAAPRTDTHGQPIGAAVEAWVAPPAPSRRSIEGRHCRLTPLLVDHAPALHAANTSAENWDFLPYGPFENEAAYAAWVAEMARLPDPLFFVVEVDGRPVGVASYLRIDPAHGTIEVGHINFSPALQRTVAATEAMVLMMGWAFEAGYRRLEWKCNALNMPSRRAALRLGLSFEGVFLNATVSKGRNRDTAWYAATDGEWPSLTQAFATWLAPGNFDEAGRQRQSLADLTRPVLVKEG